MKKTRPCLWVLFISVPLACTTNSPVNGKGGNGGNPASTLLAENARSIVGSVEREMLENFANDRFETRYHLRSMDGRTRHAIDDRGENALILEPGTNVSAVFGEDGKIDATSLQILGYPDPTKTFKPEKGTSLYTLAVVRASFSDIEPEGYFSMQNLPGFMDAVEGGLSRFTNGKVILHNRLYADSGRDIYDVLLGGFSSGSPCDTSGWQSAANASVLEKYGVDLSEYDWIVYFVPPLASCWFSGASGTRTASILYEQDPGGSGDKKVKTTIHEIGHLLGLGHATNDGNNDGVKDSEYGDHSSIMGGASLPLAKVNAPQMIQLGLFQGDSDAVFVAETGGTYGITSLHESSVKPRRRILKVYSPSKSTFYFVSYRTDAVNYNGTPSSDIPKHRGGVSIHRASVGGSASDTLWVKNLKSPGDAFVDGPDLTIRFLSQGDDFPASAQVEVDYGFSGSWISMNLPPVAYDTEHHIPTSSSVLHFQFEDPDGPDGWTYEIVKTPNHAKAFELIHGNYGTFIYILKEVGYIGSDTIQWKVSDGIQGSNVATMDLSWE